MKTLAIIGGGAAGFFAALTAAESKRFDRIIIFERSARFLSKLKISGGGRCNVTHSCFEPAKLASHYPRGARELRAAFHHWQPQDTIHWFKERGVAIKREADGRMFPTTDDSQTIIDCFLNQARKARIELRKECGIKSFTQHASHFTLHLSDDSQVNADKLIITTGSLKASPLTRSIEALGHHIVPLVPSLFAFNLADKRTHGLAGLSVPNASVRVLAPSANKKQQPASQTGPLLITHRGLSGPAILRTSAWEARRLYELNYHFEIEINWLGTVSENQLREHFSQARKTDSKKAIKNTPIEPLPKRLWERLIAAANINDTAIWAQLPKKAETQLIEQCLRGRYAIQGKTTNKDEFVTAGGIERKEINWKTMESKLAPNLHFAGECIDIDGITGGFNFQAAWTTGRLAGLASTMSE